MIQLNVSDMVGFNRTQKDVKRHHRSSIDKPVYRTAKAISKGYRISQFDGPLPIADAIGFTYALFQAGEAWYDFFN